MRLHSAMRRQKPRMAFFLRFFPVRADFAKEYGANNAPSAEPRHSPRFLCSSPTAVFALSLCNSPLLLVRKLLVLLFRCLAAAQVAFLLVAVKHLLYLLVERHVYIGKPCGDVLMYGAFTYAELFRSAAHCLAALRDIFPQNDTSFGAALLAALIFFHEKYHPRKKLVVNVLFCTVYASAAANMIHART